MSAYLDERLHGDASNTPHLALSLPLHTELDLQTSQKNMDLVKIKTLLTQTRYDAILYFGYENSFRQLVDKAQGGDPSITDHWITGDGVSHSILQDNSLNNIQLAGLFFYEKVFSDKPDFYYAFDAGQLLVKTMDAVAINTSNATEVVDLDRAKFLEAAKKITLSAQNSLSGAKTFTSADQSNTFFVHYINDAGKQSADIIKVTQD